MPDLESIKKEMREAISIWLEDKIKEPKKLESYVWNLYSVLLSSVLKPFFSINKYKLTTAFNDGQSIEKALRLIHMNAGEIIHITDIDNWFYFFYKVKTSGF